MQKPITMNLSIPKWSITPSWSSVCESHGRSISSGPLDWPGLALRRSAARADNRRKALGEALTVLNERERRIFEGRRLADEPITLDELAHEYGVSRERVRQIEVDAFEKVQNAVKDRVAGIEMRPRGSGARHRQNRGQAPGIDRLQELQGQDRELVVSR